MDAMLIECILKRDGGSKVDLGGITYHFAPDSEGRHVAMVADPDHIGRLLSITEGYRIPRASTSATAQAAVTAPIGAVGAVAPATVTAAQEPVVDAVDLTEAPNEPEKADEAPVETAEGEPAPLESMTKEQLAALYLEKTGKKSHPATTQAKLIELIKAASAA